MTKHEVVALRCPACGSGIREVSRDRAFGAEFRCDRCEITSVLIVNRDLVPLNTLQKVGEKVCRVCGRVAQREARFCQEGHPLVRRCIHPPCEREFPVDYHRCDFCGRSQDGPLELYEIYHAIVDRIEESYVGLRIGDVEATILKSQFGPGDLPHSVDQLYVGEALRMQVVGIDDDGTVSLTTWAGS